VLLPIVILEWLTKKGLGFGGKGLGFRLSRFKAHYLWVSEVILRVADKIHIRNKEYGEFMICDTIINIRDLS